MHIGPVADDNIYQTITIRLYETGVFSVDETTKRFKAEVLHEQLVFHSDKALSFLEFVDVIEIKGGEFVE